PPSPPAGAVARPGGALTGPVLPPRAVLQPHRAGKRRRGEGGAPRRVLAQPVRLRQDRLRQPGAAEARLRGLARPLSDQGAGLLRRGHRLPRGELLPGGREGRGVRAVGARARHRHGGVLGRGVPLLQGVLAGEPRPPGRSADGLRPARQPEPHRRLSLRGPPGRADGGRRRVPSLPAQGRTQARDRAAHQHVLPRREHQPGLRRLPPRGARLRRAPAQLRERRVAVASARQPPHAERQPPPDGEAPRVRPSAARSRLRTLPGPGDAPGPPGERAVATRRDGGTVKDAQRFVIDFAGKKLAAIPADRVLHGVVTVAGGVEAGELLEEHVVKNPFSGGWRLTFQVRPKKREPLELRAFLEQGGDTLTETWSYVILP